MKHFELKCRDKIKEIASQCLVKETSNREVVEELSYWWAFRKEIGKQIKGHVTWNATYLIEDN